MKPLSEITKEIESMNVHQCLDELPGRIAYAAEQVEVYDKVYREAKLRHKHALMRAMLESNQTTAQAKKADAEVKAIGEESKLTEAENNRNLIKVRHDYLTDKFIAVRKKCELLKKQLN